MSITFVRTTMGLSLFRWGRDEGCALPGFMLHPVCRMTDIHV
jgi:hypothetical protein